MPTCRRKGVNATMTATKTMKVLAMKRGHDSFHRERKDQKAEELIQRFYSVQTVVFPIKSLYRLPFPGVAAQTLYHPHLRQDTFLKEEFHYLRAPVIGTRAVIDNFDCSFECLSCPLCYSYNLAASQGADGKFWCELLSSDKYSHPGNYSGNQSSHYFVAMVILRTSFFTQFISLLVIQSYKKNFTVYTSDASLLNSLYSKFQWIRHQEYQDTN